MSLKQSVLSQFDFRIPRMSRTTKPRNASDKDVSDATLPERQKRDAFYQSKGDSAPRHAPTARLPRNRKGGPGGPEQVGLGYRAVSAVGCERGRARTVHRRYAFLGALRSAAQMVSYEVSIGLILITVLICVGPRNSSEIVMAQKQIWSGIPLFHELVMFFISRLAETNRAPFDHPEAEAESVAGYNVEYARDAILNSPLLAEANVPGSRVLILTETRGGSLPTQKYSIFGKTKNVIGTLHSSFETFECRVGVGSVRLVIVRPGRKVFLPLSLARVAPVSGFLVTFQWLFSQSHPQRQKERQRLPLGESRSTR
ncbi:NADH-ubiquinone oxidoreductase chain 1-like [Raphanus sativus]|uniref:NADH-ubiquinone oxidoreductase chain 1-like n=1 Tax=Raphanus sativus TaxID=3726 RepID=A0A9W3CNP9_RAPSA|nr:NADH-ubiquinone oxidoreductase chain 1-like [Raphanus sativus]